MPKLLSLLCTLALLAPSVQADPPADRVIGRSTSDLPLPPGHLPPPGSSRVWYPDRPPGQQPPPHSHAVTAAELPPGAWLVTRSKDHPDRVHITRADGSTSEYDLQRGRSRASAPPVIGAPTPDAPPPRTRDGEKPKGDKPKTDKPWKKEKKEKVDRDDEKVDREEEKVERDRDDEPHAERASPRPGKAPRPHPDERPRD